MTGNGDTTPNEPIPNEPAPTYDLTTQNGRRAKASDARRSRLARRRANKAKQAELRAERKAARRARKPRCKATTKLGQPCKAAAVTDDGFCVIHSNNKALMEQARAIRNQATLKPHEMMRQVVESNPLAFMQPYLDALGIRVVFVPDENNPELLHPTAVQDPTSQGAVLYGVSKDGHVMISKHKDIEAQQRAAERLFDRVYGKPKQTQIIASSADNQDPQLVPFDDKRQAEVAAILEAAKQPSHGIPPNSNN